MTPDERDRLTRLEARFESLHADVAALLLEQRRTNDFLSEIRGGRAVMWKLLAAASAVGGVVGWLADRLLGGVP